MSRRLIQKALRELIKNADPNCGLVGREITPGEFNFSQPTTVIKYYRPNPLSNKQVDLDEIDVEYGITGHIARASSIKVIASTDAGTDSNGNQIFLGGPGIGGYGGLGGNPTQLGGLGFPPTTPYHLRPFPEGGAGNYKGIQINQGGAWWIHGYISVAGNPDRYYRTEHFINDKRQPYTWAGSYSFSDGTALVPVNAIINIPPGAFWNVVVFSRRPFHPGENDQFAAIGMSNSPMAPYINITLMKLPSFSYGINF